MKYGDLPDLKPGEPFFVLRGQDLLAPSAVNTYAGLLAAASASARELGVTLARWGDQSAAREAQEASDGLRRQCEEVRDIAVQMLTWQIKTGVSKLPD